MPQRTETLQLQEYETSAPIELSDETLSAARMLLSDRVSVIAGDRGGRYMVKATSWVGTIVLPGLTVRIRPKVADLRNVLMMFGAAGGLASWGPHEGVYSTDDLVEGIAELVLREIDAATRRGLVRGYQPRQERVSALRGRLMVEQLATRPWDVYPAPCEYTDYTADVSENRVLRAVVRLIQAWALSPSLRRHSLLLLHRLDEVSDSTTPLLELQTVQRSPVNDHYTAALSLSGLVLTGVGISHLPGGTSALSFLVNMNDLFERWIGAELAARLWPPVDVVEQANVALSVKPSVPMKPDLLFKVRGKDRLVGDVKYKLTSTGISRNADYYQLLAYATALRLPRGVLIYCQADDAPPREIRVQGGGQTLLCHPLPLNGSPKDVAASLDDLSSTISMWAGVVRDPLDVADAQVGSRGASQAGARSTRSPHRPAPLRRG